MEILREGDLEVWERSCAEVIMDDEEGGGYVGIGCSIERREREDQ